MDLFLPMLAVVLVGGFVLALAKRVWLFVSWRVLGFKPQFLNEEQVKRTVEELTGAAMELDMVAAATAGHEMSEEEKARHFTQVEDYTRAVIERYIHNFMTHA
jgi:hypothetical protein